LLSQGERAGGFDPSAKPQGPWRDRRTGTVRGVGAGGSGPL